MRDLNIRRLLEENIGGKLLDIGFDNEFLDLTAKAKATRAKVSSGTHQTKKLLYSKGTH